MNNTKTTHVDNEQFVKELTHCYNTETFSNELGTMILKLINGLLHSHRFIGYSGYWHEEMYSAALNNCVSIVTEKKFDITKSANAFGYFYASIVYSFLTAIKYLHQKKDAQEVYKDYEYARLMREYPEAFVYVAPTSQEDDFSGGDE